MKKIEYYNFIHGTGLERVKKAVEMIKLVLRKRHFNFHRNERNLIMAIRLEHIQIKKHQKLAMKYLYELEQKIYPKK